MTGKFPYMHHVICSVCLRISLLFSSFYTLSKQRLKVVTFATMKLSNLSDIRASQAWGWEPQSILDCTNVYTHTLLYEKRKKKRIVIFLFHLVLCFGYENISKYVSFGLWLGCNFKKTSLFRFCVQFLFIFHFSNVDVLGN